jgi:amidophosphoribosyltransferase
VEADSLSYLSVEGMVGATEIPADDFCTACFTSKYPIPVPEDQLRSKHVLERPPLENKTPPPGVPDPAPGPRAPHTSL